MNAQFTKATEMLLRKIDCPCFADENRAAVNQFLSDFSEHLLRHIAPSDMRNEEIIQAVRLNLPDMEQENG